MKNKTKEWIMEIGLISALIFVAISLIINTTKSCDVFIDYDVEIGFNKTGANLAEVKLACYKLCAEEMKHDTSMMRDCFNKCEKLE